jgi:hypothetical protein
MVDFGTKREYSRPIQAELRPVPVRWRLLTDFVALAALAVVARLALEAIIAVALVAVIEDPYPDHGGAIVSFVSERPEEVRVFSFEVEASNTPGLRDTGHGYTVTGPSGRGTKSPQVVSAPEGRRSAVVRYRIGDAGETEIFAFDIQLVALSQCDVRVVFAEDGPRASPCVNHRPASYGGTWRH